MTLRPVLATILFTALASCTVGEDPVDDADADSDDGQLDEAVVALASDPDSLTTTADTATTDRDADGIPDAVEEMLLRRYRPYYRFSQARRQRRVVSPGKSGRRARERAAQDRRPRWRRHERSARRVRARRAITTSYPRESLYTCRADTSFLVAHAKTDYALNLDNATTTA